MAKKAKQKPHNDTVQLRQWCIEQANSWKWDAGDAYRGMATGGFPSPGRPSSEPDIIARADRILGWVAR